MSTMKLHFDEISGSGRQMSIDGSQWLSPLGEESLGLLTYADLLLRRTNPETVHLQGVLDGKKTTECDRCGNEVKIDLHIEFEYWITFRDEQLPEGGEFECSDEDAQFLYLREPVIDVDEILHEQVVLAIPQQILCKEDCRGVCAGCGADLNSESCRCARDRSNSPFSVLAELGKKKK